MLLLVVSAWAAPIPASGEVSCTSSRLGLSFTRISNVGGARLPPQQTGVTIRLLAGSDEFARAFLGWEEGSPGAGEPLPPVESPGEVTDLAEVRARVAAGVEAGAPLMDTVRDLQLSWTCMEIVDRRP